VTLGQALTIAGSDPSGGAGIQADLKTFHQHRVYGMAVVTLLTAQSTLGVTRVDVCATDLVEAQLDTLLDDLCPGAAKTGALGSAAMVHAVAERARRFAFPLVVDPVMISKHGAPLLDEDARVAVARRLMPLATLFTPNAHEAEALTGRAVKTLPQARDAARALLDAGARAVLVKGGHLEGDAVDVLAFDGVVHELRAPRLDVRHTYGTGCTYAAAITARLARGESLEDAVRGGKEWLTRAIAGAPGIGRGVGPVDHFTAERSTG
jgi:hydroxymethylpyrimidine/phosphomethylpyrimidine kinase